MMWTCDKCGEELDEIQRICWSCGAARQVAGKSASPPAAESLPAEQRTSSPRRAARAPVPARREPAIIEDEPAKTQGRSRAWRLGRWGLSFIRLGVVLAMCAWAFNMLLTTIWDLYDPIELQAELQRLDVTAANAEFIVDTLNDSLPKIQRHCQTVIRLGGAGTLLGLCLCCTVSVKSKVREVVIGSTLLLGLSLFMRLAFSPEGQSSVAGFVTTCSMVVSAGLFLLFLNGLGWFFDDKALAGGTVRLFVFAVAMGVIRLFVIPSMSRAGENYEFGVWLTAFDGLAAAISLVWCLRLVRSARLAILRGPKPAAETTAD